MERGGGGSSSGGGSGLGEDNRCACGRTLQMVGVHVSPTTGGQFQLRVASTDSIEFLRRLVSKRLRVPKERICLLYRDRHLREGTLEENSILDGARITLLPSVETGLLTQRPEQSVMQALESLNDGQVNDFLTGKAPLNLTMRLGDHMMLIQLQLSTVSPGGSRKTRLQPTHSHAHTHTHAHTHAHSHAHTHTHTHTHTHSHSHDHGGGAARTSTHTHPLTPPYTPHTTCSGYSPVHTAHVSSQSTIPASMTINPSQTTSSTSTASNTPTRANSPSSPSSLSSTSSSPSSSTSATLHNHQHNLLHHHHHHHYSMGCGSPSSPPPPYLATPPHHHHHHHHHHRPTPGSPSTPNSPTSSSSSGSNSSSPSGFGYDGELPVRGCPHRGEDADPRASLDTKALAEASRNLTQTLKQLSSEVLTSKPEPKEDTVTPHEVAAASLGTLGGNSSSSSSSTGNSSSSNSGSTSSSSSTTTTTTTSSSSSSSNSGGSGFSSNSSSSSSSSNSFGGVRKQGAIIESMHHHGKGVYSGTFSGTLNPALQDRQGRPKRDISTIIHILNDLLCATPQYRRHSTSISVSTSTPTTIRNRNNGGNAKRGTQQTVDVSTSGLQSHDSMTDAYGRKAADSAQNVDQVLTDSGDENQAMRTKVEQLRMIMEQRRARRKARRDARARPYPHTAASWATDTSVPTVVTTSGTAATSTTQAMDVDGGKADGADPTTLCELNSETVVA